MNGPNSYALYLLLSFQGHSSFITHLDWSADGSTIRSNSGDYELLYCNIPSLTSKWLFHSFSFSPSRDGFLLPAEHPTILSSRYNLGFSELRHILRYVGRLARRSWRDRCQQLLPSQWKGSHRDGRRLWQNQTFCQSSLSSKGILYDERWPFFSKRDSVSFQAKFTEASGHSSHVTCVQFLHNDTRLISIGGRDSAVMQWMLSPARWFRPHLLCDFYGLWPVILSPFRSAAALESKVAPWIFLNLVVKGSLAQGGASLLLLLYIAFM